MTFRARVTWSGDIGGTWLSTHYGSVTTGTTAQQFADAIVSFWQACEPSMPTSATWTLSPEVEVFDPATGNITSIDQVVAASGSGTSGGSQLAGSTQGLLRLRTGNFIQGREIRGRLFIPAPTETQNGDGRPVVGYRTMIDDAWANAWAALPNTPVVWSPTHGVEAGIESASTWANWAVLRSRRD